MKMSANTTTTFISRGTLAGLIRDRPPSGTRRHRAGRDRAGRAAPPRPAVDEALYYRARLILGESLPRPSR
jgi:hypothetical protein